MDLPQKSAEVVLFVEPMWYQEDRPVELQEALQEPGFLLLVQLE